jgi:hypothetical protein
MMKSYTSLIVFFLLLIPQITALASSQPVEPINKSDFMQWQDLGVDFFENSNYTEAIRCYSMAILLEPLDAYAMSYRGVAFNELGMYDEAIKSFDEAIELDTENVVFWTNRGNAFYDWGKYDEAIKCFDEAIRIDPIHDSAWDGKGRALFKLGRYEESSKNYIDANRAFDDARKETGYYVPSKLVYQSGQGGHDVNLTPDPETVSIGPYTISFDLGTINHTIRVREGKYEPSYVIYIFLPNDCWNYCDGANANIRIRIDNHPLDKSFSLFDPGMNWTKMRNPRNIDGLPGWISETNVSSGVCVHAVYSLDDRGNTAKGNVSIDAISAIKRYYDGSGLKGNSTIPNIMRLIDTLHITKTTIVKTTYTKVPLYVEIPENTYVTE